jgi:hypothetical protein
MVGLTLFPREDTLAVGTSSVEVSPETGTKQRSVLVLTNTSIGGQIISLAWGRDAVAGRGVTLLPGEHHVESIDKGFIPLNIRIAAISDVAGGTLAIHERILNERAEGV